MGLGKDLSSGIFLSLAIIGFWNINLFGLSLRNTFSIFLILLFAYIGGAGAGAAIGITVGFLLSLASSPDPILMGNLAICGLLAGTFKELGRPGSSIAFLLANILMTFYINRSSFVILPFWEIAGASLLLMVLPKRGIHYLKRFLDYGWARAEEQQHYGKRVQELTVGRLNEFAQVFHHLSKVFGRISERNSAVGQEELSRLFDLVADHVCKGCPLYRSCWERDFYNTYSNMFDLLTACEAKGFVEKSDIPQALLRKCLNSTALIEDLNIVYTTYRSNLDWQQRIHDCRQLVAEQLDGVSHVVTQLAAELDMDMRFRNSMEDAIRLELDKNGIHAKEVLVLEKSGGKAEVSVMKPACHGRRECQTRVEGIVSKVMGKPMSCQSRECIQAGKKDCTLHLTETRQFEVITGVARKPRQESLTCGDSYSFTAVKDGKYLLALSDGMGSGARAAEESSAVISLLENFLEAGFDQNITIKTINSILMLRSREEMFATADLCIMDLVGATADFIKIGGVPSFIRRRDKVEIIKQSALPIGILEEVQLENISVPIYDEDMIVMVTDGILDSFTVLGDGERSLANFIATLDTTNPQELADSVMEEALFHTDEEAKDDMTVMAGRIWKPV
jgi:stage II sporulation protein E